MPHSQTFMFVRGGPAGRTIAPRGKGIILPLGEVACVSKKKGVLPSPRLCRTPPRRGINAYSPPLGERATKWSGGCFIPPLGGVARSSEGGMGFTLPALRALPSKEGNSSTVLYSPPMEGNWRVPLLVKRGTFGRGNDQTVKNLIN